MDIEKSLAAAEASVDIEQGANNQEDTRGICLNCGTPLVDQYCSHCGQKDLPARQTMGELFVNFMSSFWSFESKFLKTGKPLLVQPGVLPIEYTTGKRERYYHPARLYVFISFVYFLLMTTLPEVEDKADANRFNPEEVKYDNYGTQFNFSDTDFKTKAQYDSAQQALPLEKRHGKFMRMLTYRSIELNDKYRNKGDEFRRDFTASFTNNFPKIFFLLLPVFALILKLLYIRRDFFYSEHLVFSIYYYNFFFLAGCVYMLVDQVSWLEWLTFFIGLWIAVYLLIAMKKMYRQSWRKTVVKYILFGFVFGFCVGIGLLVNLFLTLMYI